MSETHSVETFADALSAVIADYLRHLEPSAQTTIHAIRLEASGPNLTILYEQHGDAPAGLNISMSNLPRHPDTIKAERGEAAGEKRRFRP